jgi:hypothetical protein
MSTELDQFAEALKNVNGFRSGSFAVGAKFITGFSPRGLQESESGAIQLFLEGLYDLAGKAVSTLHVDTTTTGNIGPAEYDLHSYVLPENKLSKDGQSIEALYGGTFLNSLNIKRIKVYFGSTIIFESDAIPTGVGLDWAIETQIIRTGANTQKALTKFFYSSTQQSFVETEENILRNICRICSFFPMIGLIHTGGMGVNDLENASREYIEINYAAQTIDFVNYISIAEDLSLANDLKITAEADDNDDMVQETSKVWFSPEGV